MPQKVNMPVSDQSSEGFAVYVQPQAPVPVGAEDVTIKNPSIPMDTSDTSGTSEILTSLGKLDEQTLKGIDSLCHQIERENEESLTRGLMKHEEFENIMRDRIQASLKLPFDIFNSVVRCKDLSYVVHDYLSKGNEPDKPVQEIIRIIWSPLGYLAPSWLEMCCQMLLDDQIFPCFYQILGKNEAVLKDIIRKNPYILMNEQSDDLLQKRLIELLNFDFLHNQIMDNLNDKNQTVMFTTRTVIPWVMLYTDKHDGDPRFLKLFDLLSRKDVNGNAALHVNTHIITQILKFRYRTIHYKQLKELIEMKDGSDRKAVDKADGETQLPILLEHLEEKRYLLYGKPTVLIIYTTEGREGAEEEARSIYHAFDSTARFNMILEKNRSKDEICKIIQDNAVWEEYPSVKPSAFIVVLLSHGNIGVVLDYKNDELALVAIEQTMCSEILKGRPKIFITQCCQEVDNSRPKQDNLDAGGSDKPKKTPYVPKNDHFCAIMSSVSGQTAVRNEFIPRIAEKLKTVTAAEKGEGTCLMKIVSDVCQQIKAKGIKQTPIIMSTLRNEFRF